MNSPTWDFYMFLGQNAELFFLIVCLIPAVTAYLVARNRMKRKTLLPEMLGVLVYVTCYGILLALWNYALAPPLWGKGRLWGLDTSYVVFWGLIGLLFATAVGYGLYLLYWILNFLAIIVILLRENFE